MIRLYLAELIKQGNRPLHRWLFLFLPVIYLLAALYFVLLRIFGGGGGDSPMSPGTGLGFAAASFSWLGAIFAVGVASSIGSSEYDFNTARLAFTQEPRRWLHALVRAAAVLTWLLGLLVLAAIGGLVLDLAMGLSRSVFFDVGRLGGPLADLLRAAATTYPIVLVSLLMATLTRTLIGGIFIWLAYSLGEGIVAAIGAITAGGLSGALPGFLDAIVTVARAVAPWTLAGIGNALAGRSEALPAGLGAVLLIVYVAVPVLLLMLLLERRDVA
jgi:ABC-type transport system involved in multi-copper enzyme maturation permease subunit